MPQLPETKQRYRQSPAGRDAAHRANKKYYTPEVRWRSWLKYQYGITPEQWEAQFEKQGRKCANTRCKVTDPGPKGWHWDHSHKTGKGRGILCRSCNLALGHIKDSIEILLGLIEYLKESL